MRVHGTACLAALAAAATAHAQCSSFQPEYPGLTGAVNALASWDPDGDGPLPPRLVAGGAFTWNQQGSQDYIAYWDGQAWAGLGWGTDGPVNAITTRDPDADGPLPPQLIIAGDFLDVGADSTGQLVANHIARWDGAAWQPLAGGTTDGTITQLLVWDPDGPGPLPTELIAAGTFTHIGGAVTGPIARWNGVEWRALGWGLMGWVQSLTTWDPDGLGPAPPQLVATGYIYSAGSDHTGALDTYNAVAWDGTDWRLLGSTFAYGYPGTVVSFTASADGSPWLIANYEGDLYRWNGGQWQILQTDPFYYGGWVTLSHIRQISVFDPDGAGPTPERLVAVGSADYGACWMGEHPPCEWQWFSTEAAAYSADANSWDFIGVPGVNNTPPISGTFAVASGSGAAQNELLAASSAAPYALELTPPLPPIPTLTQPAAVTTHIGGSLSATSVANVPGGTYDWYLLDSTGHAQYLADRTYPDGSVVSGGATSSVTVSHLGSFFAPDTYPRGPYIRGSIQCYYTASCITAVSDPVPVTVSRCSADFNRDGNTGTDADIEDFFACIAGSCCGTCDGPDFNGDGDVGTDADIESFFSVLAGGPC